jgi:hypothetical protein
MVLPGVGPPFPPFPQLLRILGAGSLGPAAGGLVARAGEVVKPSN